MGLKRDRLICFISPLLIIAVGVLAYYNALRGPFIFDDANSIEHNAHVRQVWPLTYSMTTPPRTAASARPVAQLSFAINYALCDLHPWGWKAANLSIHLITALLLFGVVRRLLNNYGMALASALLFVAHPLTSELVNYVTQRTESMMAMFALLTAYGFIRRWNMIAVIACALGMGCKEPMVLVPVLILAMDRIFIAKSWGKMRWPVHVGLFATLGVMAYLQSGNPHSEVFAHGSELNSWNYLLTETGVILYYLRLVFWPNPLVVDYYDWPRANSVHDVLLPAMVVLVLFVLTIYALVRWPRAGFAGLVFFLVLAPSSSVLPLAGEFASERRMYLPLAAIIPFLVVLAWRVLKRFPTPLSAGLLLALLTPMVLACHERNKDYRSEVAIWGDVVQKRPNDCRGWINLAKALAEVGEGRTALMAAQNAVKIEPSSSSHRIMGVAYSALGQHEMALKEYHEALALWDDFVARRSLALEYEKMGNYKAALYWINQALAMQSDDPLGMLDQKRIAAENGK